MFPASDLVAGKRGRTGSESGVGEIFAKRKRGPRPGAHAAADPLDANAPFGEDAADGAILATF